MERHFTVTGFVVDGERTLLLWHPLLQMWVPPGGHIEAGPQAIAGGPGFRLRVEIPIRGGSIVEVR